MKRLLGFALSFFLVCSIKLSVLGRVLPVVAYQGVPRHLLNLGLLLPMVALLCALPKRHLLALGAQMCLSMICVLHLVANRTLGDILSLMSVEQLSLVGYAGAGFLSSLVFSDFLYFLDIPIWIYWVCRPPVKRIRFWTTLLAAAGSGLFLQSLLWFTLTDMDKSRLASRRKNLGVMLTAGVTEYYVVDGLDFVSEFLTQDRYVPIDSRQIEENLSQLQSSWKTVGPLAGVWKGKNLWFIQLESLQAFALDAEVDGQPVMPFLRSFARHSLQ